MRRSSFVTPRRLRDLVGEAQFPFGDDITCTGCTALSHEVQPGDLFALSVSDDTDLGHATNEATERGAVAIVCDQLVPSPLPQAIVSHVPTAFGLACHALANYPSRELPVFGVTGTLGKTTTSLLLASVLNRSRQGIATITSLAYSDAVRSVAAKQTTPGADTLATLFRAAVNNGCSHAVTEFSSMGLAEDRGAGTELAAAVITNVRRQHLGRHASLTDYRRAKERILKLLKPEGVLVLNADDAHCRAMAERASHATLTFGLHTPADVTATLVERHAWEQVFYLEAGHESMPVRTRMIGDHHIYNCLAAAAAGLIAGLSLADIVRGLEEVEYIPGRMERIECGQNFGVFVDDARTHDGLAMCLKTARQVASGRVICVASFDDATESWERPLLGRVLEQTAHVRVITGSHAANDQSLTHAHEVLDGFQHPGRAHVIPSREKALSWALETAEEGDVVVACGAGHREWTSADATTDDASWIKERLYQQAATELKRKPIVFAYSG